MSSLVRHLVGRRQTLPRELYPGARPRHFSQIQSASKDLDLREFQETFFGKQPLIFKGGFIDVPATRNWPANDFQALRRFGSKLVPVELSKGTTSYASDDAEDGFEKVEIPLSLFIDFLVQSKQAAQQGTSFGNIKVYLAQHALFDSIPELYGDVCSASFVPLHGSAQRLVPKYLTVGKGDLYNINAWIGLSTHTPLHHDPYHNIFVQLFSRKRVRMFPGSARQELSMHTDVLLKNTSSISDIFGDSVATEISNTGMEGTLESGDGLYIPEGWLHSFKGEAGITGSVNWWFR